MINIKISPFKYGNLDIFLSRTRIIGLILVGMKFALYIVDP